MTTCLFDTSAILTLRAREAGCDTVEKILRDALLGLTRVLISFVSVTEYYYLIIQKSGRAEASKAYLQLKMLPIEVVQSSEEIALQAGEFKACHPISLADAFVAATAVHEEALLIHKDPDFELMKDTVRQRPLPYKTSRSA